MYRESLRFVSPLMICGWIWLTGAGGHWIRYEVTARCDGCSSEDTTGASFTMTHAPLARNDQFPTGQP